MKQPNSWTEYQIIASGGGEKLEKWGDMYLLRPDPQAIWAPAFDLSGFRMLHGKYTRSAAGGGAWEYFKSVPDEWTVSYRNLKFIISPTNFKHTGLFPEQAVNWDRCAELIAGVGKRRGKDREDNFSNPAEGGSKVLNLFGYSGGATVAAAAAGANVTHVDASRGMTDVCRRNVQLNKIPDDRVRYIVEDCAKFVAREIRRGKTYDAIIMDPPSFGRGANGEVWKIEAHLDNLVQLCCKLLSDKPLFFLINSYTTGLQPTVMMNVLLTNLRRTGYEGKIRDIEAYEIGLHTLENITLPAGCSTMATFKDGGK
ncbi:MAG: class I SAM-dependent methyltransferase [Firmicutes bacterium]|nr:class I SAM-dependent methyltransferase [Bacillota bacterium]